jgi:hypothetical protein
MVEMVAINLEVVGFTEEGFLTVGPKMRFFRGCSSRKTANL